MSEIELWRSVPGASADGHLGSDWYSLPESVQRRARSELKKSDPFVLFVVRDVAGLVTSGRGAPFSAKPNQITVEILSPAKGGGGVTVIVDRSFVARWAYSRPTIPRITDAARFIANQLGCQVEVLDLGPDA